MKITSMMLTLSLIITYLLGLGGRNVEGDLVLARQEKLNPIVSMYSAQGLCCDGTWFYGSGAMTAVHFTGLSKFDLQMKCIKRKANAVPKEFTERYGSDHIGGIDCADGLIYAPVEGEYEDQGYVYNFILLYSCETLEYTGVYYDLTSDYLTDGIPWCAVDRENRILYTSKFDDVHELLQYDLDSMEFLGVLPLQQTVNRIQGGSVYNGQIYLSYDAAHSTDEQILCVDLQTGTVSVFCTRHMPNYDNEAEDLCVYPLADGTLIHTVDYDKLLNVNVMHYQPLERSDAQ
ncbi:MAG: hypothetical protein IJK64_03160 [Clostridia bacterium]|nr:hypothetical protein [Clostridia bacterium]